MSIVSRSICRVLSVIAVVMIGIYLVPSVRANGFRNPPASASALGMSGGKIATINDASAIAINPANLTGIPDGQVLGSLTLGYSDIEYTDPLGNKSSSSSSWTPLPNLYGAWRLGDEKGTVAGFGIMTPYGQSTEWSKTGPFLYTAPYFAELSVVDFSPVIAFPMGHGVSIGVGADIFWSDLDFRQMYPWASVTGNPMTPAGEAKFDGDGWGLGGNIAINWQFVEGQRVALTYRLPVKVDYEGDMKINNIPSPALGVSDRTGFETDITFPAIVGFGYGFDLSDTLTLGIDVEWIEFSSYDALPLNIDGANQSLLPSDRINEDWNDTWTFGFGLSWQMSDAVILRAGYSFLETPVPDETLSPTLPDADRHVVSLGLGYRKGPHCLDLAGVISFFEDRDIRSDENPAYNGKYENTADILAVSYAYSF